MGGRERENDAKGQSPSSMDEEKCEEMRWLVVGGIFNLVLISSIQFKQCPSAFILGSPFPPSEDVIKVYSLLVLQSPG